MSAFRRVPRVEGRAAAGELGRAVVLASLATVAWIAVHSYWPAELTEPDERTREQIVRYVVAVLAVLVVVNLVAGVFHAGRWARAWRWERLLADPVRAHLVPPLASHLAAVPSKGSRFGVLGGCALLPLAGIALIVYGSLGLAGRIVVASSEGEDASAGYLSLGIALVVLTVPAARRARTWLLADKVERLSSDTTLAAPARTAVAVAPRATSVPELDVEFYVEDDDAAPHLASRWAALTGDGPPHIIYFRLFENVRGTKRFLGGWRFAGYVYTLRSADQVTAEEVEAAEAAGSVASMFITTTEQLDAELARARMERRQLPPVPSGMRDKWRWMTNSLENQSYPQRALLCHGNFWKTAVDLLLQRMDLVMVDLTGFGRENTGTAYELQRVIDLFPIERVTLLADRLSDQPFVAAQVRAAWARMAAGSPNAGTGSRTVHVELRAT